MPASRPKASGTRLAFSNGNPHPRTLHAGTYSGLWSLRKGPHHGGPGPAPPASAFRLSSRPLPPLALCRLHCREHGQRRLPARPLTAQVLSSFPPKRDEEGHRPSFVRCSSLDQPAGSKGRVPPGWCASCPFETACGEARLPGEGAGASGKGTQGLPGKGAKASGRGGQGFRERGPGLPEKGAKASGKGGRGPLLLSPWAGRCGASRFGSATFRRWEASPSLSSLSLHITFLQTFLVPRVTANRQTHEPALI